MNWLQVLRLRAGLEQTEVAQLMGVSTRTYRRWEADPERMRVETVRELLNCFGLVSIVIAWTPPPLRDL